MKEYLEEIKHNLDGMDSELADLYERKQELKRLIELALDAREIRPEIKPCTNYEGCGEMYVDRYDLGRQGNYIRCRGCGARGPHAETPQQAIEEHNEAKR